MSRALDRNQRKATVALRRLATGSRVERASDGAAELARVNALRAQLAGYRAASRSIEANQALLRTAETALGEQMTILQRMRELTVRYSSGSLSAVDRTHIQAEFETSRSELDRIAEQTQFNGHPLLTGAAQTLGLTLGPSPGDRLSYSLRASRSGSLGTVHELTTSAYNANIVLADQDAFASGDVLLSGSPVRPTVASDDSVSSHGAAASAIAKAQAINDDTAAHGVTATVSPTVVTGASAVAAFVITSGFTSINGVDIGAVNVQANDADGALRSAINAVSSQTGVVATLSSTNRLVLTAEDGRNIQTSNTSLVAFIGGRVYISSLTLRSSDAIEIGGGDPGKLGLSGGETSILLGSLASLNVSGAAGISSIETMDVAIAQMSQRQAEVGAVLSRLERASSGLAGVTDHADAARGRLQDADFAREAAQLVRHQTLRSVGASLLAQSNVGSRQALDLLTETL